MVNNYHITRAAGWDGPHGTGHFQDSAGRGLTERQGRGAAVRMGQMMPLPPAESPLDANVAYDFAQSVAPKTHIARDMIVSGVLAGALTRYIQMRRGRR